jgi:hypothetical protein
VLLAHTASKAAMRDKPRALGAKARGAETKNGMLNS